MQGLPDIPTDAKDAPAAETASADATAESGSASDGATETDSTVPPADAAAAALNKTDPPRTEFMLFLGTSACRVRASTG
jgi:hypothetical protein